MSERCRIRATPPKGKVEVTGWMMVGPDVLKAILAVNRLRLPGWEVDVEWESTDESFPEWLDILDADEIG